MAKAAKKTKEPNADIDLVEIRNTASRIRRELFLDVTTRQWEENQLGQLLDMVRALSGIIEIEVRLNYFLEQTH